MPGGNAAPSCWPRSMKAAGPGSWPRSTRFAATPWRSWSASAPSPSSKKTERRSALAYALDGHRFLPVEAHQEAADRSALDLHDRADARHAITDRHAVGDDPLSTGFQSEHVDARGTLDDRCDFRADAVHAGPAP